MIYCKFIFIENFIFAALFGGHYTAFTKQHNDWFYFNDETYSKVIMIVWPTFRLIGHVLIDMFFSFGNWK